MAITIDGSNGISDVRSTTDGSASTPAIRGTDTNTGIFFPAADTIAFAEGGSECARFDSTGHLGIGTTTPNLNGWNKALTVNTVTGGYSAAEFSANNVLQGYIFSLGGSQFNIASKPAIPLVFGTNDTERMRINPAGYTRMSNTGNYFSTTGEYHEIRSSTANGEVVVIDNTATSSPYGITLSFRGAAPNNTTNYFLFCGDTTNSKAIIYSSGTIQNRTGSYTTFSDLKLKENIVDTSPKLEKLNQVRVVNYNLIDDDLKQIGFVAQELEQVFPNLVFETPDLDENKQPTGEVTKGVKLTVMIPILVKAIQEQQAQLTDMSLTLANANALIQSQADTITAMEVRLTALEQA